MTRPTAKGTLRARMRELHAQGYSQQRMADELGATKHLINMEARAMGLGRQPSGGYHPPKDKTPWPTPRGITAEQLRWAAENPGPDARMIIVMAAEGR